MGSPRGFYTIRNVQLLIDPFLMKLGLEVNSCLSFQDIQHEVRSIARQSVPNPAPTTQHPIEKVLKRFYGSYLKFTKHFTSTNYQ